MKTLSATLTSALLLSLSACGPDLAQDGARSEFATQSQTLNCTKYGTVKRTVSVRTGTELQDALDDAAAGDDIVLATGNYALSGTQRFTLTNKHNGTQAAPIVIRSATPQGAVLRSPIDLQGSFAVLSGVDVDGDFIKKPASEEFGTAISVGGLSNRVTRVRIRDTKLDVIAVGVVGNKSVVDHCELSGMRNRGISVEADKANSPRIYRNHLHDWVGTRNANGHEGVQLGQQQSDTDQDLFAVLEYNLFEDLNVDQETVSVKSSSNTVRFNTLVRARNITNRHGEDNVYTANFFRSSEGLNVHDQGNTVEANVCLNDCKPGFRVMAGGTNPDSTVTSPAPFARDTVLQGNKGPIIVAHSFGKVNSAGEKLNLLPTGTRISTEQRANVETYEETKPKIAYFDFNVSSLPTARELLPSQVGLDADSCE